MFSNYKIEAQIDSECQLLRSDLLWVAMGNLSSTVLRNSTVAPAPGKVSWWKTEDTVEEDTTDPFGVELQLPEPPIINIT